MAKPNFGLDFGPFGPNVGGTTVASDLQCPCPYLIERLLCARILEEWYLDKVVPRQITTLNIKLMQ